MEEYRRLIKEMIDQIDNVTFLSRIYSFVKSKYERTKKEGV